MKCVPWVRAQRTIDRFEDFLVEYPVRVFYVAVV